MMDAFWAVPEWAPADESHLLGSLSAVSRVSYAANAVTYSTFDAESTDILRLDFVPTSVTAGGKPLERRQDLSAEGYTYDEAAHVLRIHHLSSRDIDVQGRGGAAPPRYVTFDDPHLPAGSVLAGAYPSGVVDWPGSQWQIGPPAAKFGTFNLVLKSADARSAAFRFAAPRIFQGFDVANDGPDETTITIRTEAGPERPYTIKPGQLRRIRIKAHDPTTAVELLFENASPLRFDNLAYTLP